MNKIRIRGARTHNLKNINLDLKINKITCLAGPSGSGKTSLAFHTLLTESKRRYLNSFPNDFKFFFDIPNTVDVDEIAPVLPVWGLSQINPVVGSRPVVADHLGIHQDLEKIFFMDGFPACHLHKKFLQRIKNNQAIVNQIELKSQGGEVVASLLVDRDRYKDVFGHGAFPARSFSENDNTMRAYDIRDQLWEIGRYKRSSLEKLSQQLESEFKRFEIQHLKLFIDRELKSFNNQDEWVCPDCEVSSKRLATTPFELSPYNPVGACSECQGHGMNLVYDRDKLVREPHLSIKEGAVYLVRYSRFVHYLPALIKFFKKEGLDPGIPFQQLPDKKWNLLFDGGDHFPGLTNLIEYLEAKKYKKNVRIYLRGLQKEVICQKCSGSRLSQLASQYAIEIDSKVIFLKDLVLETASNTAELMVDLKKKITEKKKKTDSDESVLKLISSLILKLNTSDNLNLNNLKLNTKVKSLLVGEYQKLLLAKILSYEGSGALFILDEPSVGLSLTEQQCLFHELENLRSQGNTILIVDHSELIQKLSDEIIVMGPGAGHEGGEILYQGKFKSSKSKIEFKKEKNTSPTWPLMLSSRNINYRLINDLSFESNRINVLKGVSSSSQKHQIATSVLFNLISTHLSNKDQLQSDVGFQGFDYLKSCYFFDGGLGRMTSRSTIGSTTGLSQLVRKEFCRLPLSKALELEEGHFSAYSPIGQCTSCEGRGVRTVDMQFLEDIQFTCDDCRGMKIKPYYGSMTNGSWSFHEVMNRPMSKVLPSIRLTPKFQRIYDSIQKLNLDYLELDRPLITLSGGERIRVKLLSNLETIQSQNIYIFDNLSLGLSKIDLYKVMSLLRSIAMQENTFILIDESPIVEEIADKVLKL